MPQTSFALVKTHRRFESAWNKLQVAIEIGVTLIVIAGLLGTFGNGYLSQASARSADGSTTIVYERFVRRTVPGNVTISVKAAATRRVDVRLPKTFVDAMQVVSTLPMSATSRAETGGDITDTFALGAEGDGSITINAKPQSFGLVTTSLTVNGTTIPLTQIIYP